VIFANLEGAGLGDTGISLMVEAGPIICESSEMVSYGRLMCKTTATTINSGSNI